MGGVFHRPLTARHIRAALIGAVITVVASLSGSAPALAVTRAGGHGVVGVVDTVTSGLKSTTGRVESPTSGVKSVSVTHKLYWGAVTGTQFTGDLAPWDMRAVTDFQRRDSGGKGESIIPMYQPWEDCSKNPCTAESFPLTPFDNIRADGAIPMVSWSSASLQSRRTDPDFTLAKVVDGTYDSEIRAWATAARDWGHPFFLRFDWEMNGDWFNWSGASNPNGAAEFVAAWRHVHNIFTSVGATNATWVWCPNVSQAGVTSGSFASYYPGNGYVDWTCMDGYNWGTSGAGGPGRWQSFGQVFSASYQQLVALAPGKPMMLGEAASTTQGGSQAAWIASMLAELPTLYPKLDAVIYYDNAASGTDWPIESSLLSRRAFAAGIASPAYVSSSLGGESASPIPAA